MAESFARKVSDALQECRGFKTIDELQEFVVERVGIPEEFSRRAVSDCVKSLIRRELKKFKDRDGLAQWESIEQVDPDGETQKKYVQLTLCNKDEYRVMRNYYAEKTHYYARKTNTLTKRCNEQHGTDYQMPFPSFGLLSDDQEEAA